MKNRLKIKKIISSLLVVCMMIQLIPQSAMQINASGVTEIDLNTAAVNDIYLLTKEQFVQTENGVETGQGEYRLTDSGNNEVAKNVYVGDTTYKGQEYTGSDSIKIELQNIKNSLNLLQVYPISQGSYTADFSVSKASKINKLQMEKNAKVKITLDDDLELSEISMADGSELKVDTQGHKFKVTGDITGSGSITFTGDNIDIAGIKTGTLTLDKAQIKANQKKITATDEMTIKSSTVESASLLGYDEDCEGSKTLSFEGTGNELKDITAIGTSATGRATITIKGQDTITSSADTTYYCDYSLTYQYNDEELSPEQEWPVSYRVKFQGSMSGNNSEVTGYHKKSGSYVTGEVKLPEYTTEGYSYLGWKTAANTDTVATLPTDTKENQTLTAVLKSDNVVVSLDLGYQPDATTNDDYQELQKVTTQTDKEWGDTISLDTPSRFGYQFAGWKATSIKDGETYKTQKTYQVTLDDAKKSKDGEYQIVLEAQWEAKKFPLRFMISNGVDKDNLEIKVGETTYNSIQEFVEKHSNVQWDDKDRLLQFGDISYGESLKTYLEEMGISEIPQLIDKRTGDQKFDFSGWSTPGGNLLTDDMSFTVGSILDSKSDKETLKDYEAAITATPVLLTSQWGTASYTLTTDIVDGWEILVDGKVQTPTAVTKLKNALTNSNTMSIKVKAGSEITWRCSASNAQNFSLWNFTEGFLPEETTMTSGAKYISYIATMPYKDITATMSKLENTYIDISQSSITFEEDVKLPSGRTVDGFWYDKQMEVTTFDGMDDMNINAMTPAFQADASDTKHTGKYFYIWNFKDTFRLTSCGKETQNQLTLVNAMTVSMKDCKFKATDAYKQDAVKRKLKGIVLEGKDGATLQTALAGLDLRQYGNIILDVETHGSYTTQIESEGENAAGVIVQSHFDPSNAYSGTLNVNGTEGKDKDQLTISGTLLNEAINFTSMTLLQDTDVESDYLLYCDATNEGIGGITFSGCDIKAEEKRIYTYRGSITFKQDNKKEDSSVNIGGVRTYGPSYIRNNTYIRCFGDWIGAYSTLYMYDSSNVVIDQNLLTTYSHWTSGARIETTGYLIIKGNRAELENLTLNKGTIIANAAIFGRSAAINGGSVIANQLMNSPAKYPAVGSDGNYEYRDGGSCEAADKNGDNYLFQTYSQNSSLKGQFIFGKGSKVYLLGYYKTSADRVYDTSVKAVDSDNPVAKVLDKVIADNGDLNKSAALSDTELQNMVKNSSNTQNECVMFGNSNYNTTARMREVIVSGAEIYAAGNMTFFNDTKITSGSVYCNGNLSSKRDLDISGNANVTATEVGNNYNLKTTDDSGMTRWQKTTIGGGTITTDRLGAASASYGENSNITSRTTLDVSGSPTINARTTEAEVTYTTDTYINYIADKDTFTLPTENPDSIRYEGNDYQSLKMDKKIRLLKPIPKTGSETADWALDSLYGESVDTIHTDAGFSFDNTALSDKNAYKQRDNICLYAVKGQYDLSVAEGKNEISKIEIGNHTYTDFDSAISADKGAKVTVTLNDTSMAGKSVIWYQDATGKYYNVNPEETTQNGQTILTFTMPVASVQIYVTNEMKLCLNRYEISITKDGFRTQYDAETDGKNESSFKYAGNVVITQDNIEDVKFVGGTIGINGHLTGQTTTSTTTLTTGATTNRLHIESINSNHSITLNKIIMDGGMDEDKIIVEEDCGNVELQIDGAVRVLSTYLQTGSTLTWKGKNEKTAGDDTQDMIQFDSGNGSTRNVTGFIHNGETGQTDSVAFEDLNIIRTNKYYASTSSSRRPLVYSPSKKTSAEVVFKNCNMEATVESSMTLVSNYPKVTVENSKFDIATGIGWNSVFFNSCSEVMIKGGSFSYTCGAAYDTFPVYYGVDNFCIDGAKVRLNDRNSENGNTYHMVQPDNVLPNTFTVKNAGELNVNHRIKLNKLTLSSEGEAVPKVNIGKTENGDYDGSLLCKDITVEKGEIHTGRLLISGYYSAPYRDQDYLSKTEILNQMRAGNYLAKDGTLTLKDGIIEAAEEIGGALGGTITVEDGTIISPAIGSCDKVYGYGQYLPTASENEWIYSISKIPNSITVNIKGGTINVPSKGYLGGMNSSVNISGGNVNLQDNAILGMTEAQKKQLSDDYSSKGDDIANHTDKNCLVTISGGSVEQEEGDSVSGSINAPYGSVKISGTDTKIKVSKMQSEYGSIEIKEAQNGYTNPYKGGETGIYRKDKIGIWITDTLSAQTLQISNGAQVYAKNAYAEITNNQGELSVNEAALYSTSYGEKGIVRNNDDKKYNDNPSSDEQTVFGTKMVTVSYDLNPNGVILDSDISDIQNDNVKNYTVSGTETTIDLKDLESDGYEFKGWYNNKECTGNQIKSLNTTISNDLTLYAKWEKVKVKFKIMMDSSSSDEFSDAEFEGNNNWQKEGDTYVYVNQPEITYSDKILSADGVNLKDYSTNTLGVTEVVISADDYTGTKYINAETIVTKQLAKYYKTNKEEPIILHVRGVQKRYATVTFSLNQKNGKPSDAKFNRTIGVVSMELQENVGVDKNLGSVTTFADSTVTDGNSKGLIKPYATGYTFVGWNTDANATQKTDDGWVTEDTIFKTNTKVYAIWQANTYRIEFNAGEGTWVTAENKEPEVGESSDQTLYYYWRYDTPISEKDSFWIKEETTDKYMSELPYAWKEGSTFDNEKGWTYSYTGGDGQEVTGNIDSTELLNAVFIQALDVKAGSANGNPQQTALTLKASYTPVKVSYDLNGGAWKNSENTIVTEPKYGDALYGYTQGTVLDTAPESEAINTVTGENGKTYQVISTKAKYYNQEQKYSENDYRNQLSKKGYTFEGWEDKDNDGTKVGTTPRFRNVNLKAVWKANSYSLTLNSLTEQDSQYSKFHTGNESPIEGIDVTVGEEINDSRWPSRNGDWYAYNNSDNGTLAENQKRYLLGFTFTQLDPGTTSEAQSETGYGVYQKYAQTVTNLQNNSKSLYQSQVTTSDNNSTEGTVFALPKDSDYSDDIAGSRQAYAIPDYPDGSTIQMYAVYRERSLVFVERYIDPNGNVKQNIKYSTAWSEWYNYPSEYGTSGNSDITKDGYSLIGWYVNGTTNAATPYPDNKDSYDSLKEGFKKTAENIGTYDIMVYTVYVAQLKSNITLTANSDPTSDRLSTNSYVLPSSMQTGTLSLHLNSKDSGLHLVSKNEMQEHRYDESWTNGNNTYHSDDTVAIVASIHKDSTTIEKDLSDFVTSSGDINFNQKVEAGWQLTFTLYHSKVMTKESTYNLEVQANFSELKDQWIQNKIRVKLQPSMYKVKYKIDLPEEAGKLSIDESDTEFTKPTDTKETEITKDVTLAYGSSLSDKIPQIEGYTDSSDGWTYKTSTDKYQKLNMKVDDTNNGVIDLAKSYKANEYKLSADNQTLTDWKITYSDGASDTSKTPLTEAGKDVKYHSVITFTPNNSTNPPEFITLTLGSGEEKKVKLSEYAKEDNGVYTFVMPAQDVKASYVTEETMYLEEGTIYINEDGYKQDKASGPVEKSWPGNYIILQNKQNSAANATKNQLILNGDLSGHKIEIGNLNISADDSIQLGSNTTASIVMGDQTAISSLTAKNIKVPATAKFTCNPEQTNTGSEQNALIGLNPDKQEAAIGDASGNGTITLDHLEIAAAMPAGSKAAAIGSGVEAQTAGENIAVTNSNLTVEEQSDTDIYQGIWLGGNAVKSVDIQNAAINSKNQNTMRGPLITNAEEVNITDSKIGTSDQQIPDPIYAEKKLNIASSEIYQNIQTKITANSKGQAPIGTEESGGTEITNSTINTMRTGELSEIKDFYTGSMYVKDAKSDVTIDGSQIVDLSNGSVDIQTTAYTQGSENHSEKAARKNYILLEEGTIPQTLSDVTITSIADNATIEVREPSKNNDNKQDVVKAGNFQTAADVNLVLNGNFEIAGKSEITNDSGKTVKVTAKSNAALKLTGTANAFENSKGTLKQTGGNLESSNTFGNGNLDITLNNVSAAIGKNLHAKDLTLESSTVTAKGNVGSKPESSNVTNVKISKTTIEAEKIGALGEYDKTFTMVDADDTSGLTGTIVKDEYRIAYDKNNAELDTKNLSKTLRTSTVLPDGSTTIQPSNGVPDDPSDTNNIFSGWYVNEKDGSQTVRKALKTGEDTLPGLMHNTTLDAKTPDNVISQDIKTNADKTKTLTVHAWLKATGEVVIDKGRKFETITSNTQEITTQSNGAWTLQLTSTGTFINGRDYQVTFAEKLPKGTKLTLTIPKTTQSAGSYYYYDVDDANTTTVKFSQFKKMGTDQKFQSETYSVDTMPEKETYLLSADFAQTDHTAVTNQKATVELIPEETSTSNLPMGEGVTYNLSEVTDGTINVNGKQVEISALPQDKDNLTGQQLYVKAVFTKNNAANDKAKMPFNLNATLGSMKGKWISRDTVLFKLGTYGTVDKQSETYNFEGLKAGDYRISWSLVYGSDESDNIVGNIVSNEAKSLNE